MSIFKWDQYFKVNITDANNWPEIRQILKYIFKNKCFISLGLGALPKQQNFQSKPDGIAIQMNRKLTWFNAGSALKCTVAGDLIFAFILSVFFYYI